ncbi:MULTISPECIES: RIP metalloprotease RseP [Robiginitalea]|uniref:RIP metalloprotease RseP n=2 Tax=Flavobacteriaceae TaxID=49546 RepID=UPI00234AEDCF|nr:MULTISPECIES: RIP metalloprotease RseP [unclassified Robiginitalea]MDC6353405.1 RIP metalloprotease RseP [Robiginitalea sp. PM2]MDC6373430.1 RIP metalloprotease RseP [Robiginitalea sp. SP8]
MSPILIQALQFLLSLSLLIVLHEMGHFLPAKAFKTRVEKFYLFFDIKFSLFKKKIGETVYGIGWLPLGGYVKIAGMIDESMDSEQMNEPPKPWEFRSKPAWQRLIIMLGGVTVNFLVAWVIYIGTSFAYGDAYIAADSIEDGYHVTNPVLLELGVQTGDKLVAIDGQRYEKYNDLRRNMITADRITIEREGVEREIELPEDFLGQLSTGEDLSLFNLRFPFMIGEVSDSSLNKNADLQPGDLVLSLAGEPVKYYDQVAPIMDTLANRTIPVSIERDGETRTLQLQTDENGKLGIYPGGSMKRFSEMGYFDTVTEEYSFGESIAVGGRKFVDQIGGYWLQLKKIFTPSTGAYKGVGGFKAIFDIFPDFWSWQGFWEITAFLSIMLAVLNLLPIPALDGGHVMFLLYEMVSGRKPSDKFMEYAQMVGFFLLIALILFANGNDVYKALFK